MLIHRSLLRSCCKYDIVEREAKLRYTKYYSAVVRSTQNRVDYPMQEYESDSLQVSLYDFINDANNK